MIAVRMVEVSVDQVVDVIAMRHRFMSTTRAVHVVSRVTACCLPVRLTTTVRIGG